MKLKLVRDRECGAKGCTHGKLYADDVFLCHTLEDIERDVKVQNETAIPVGTYEVRVTRSNRFGIDLPILLDVPNFSGVRIHSGNTAKDTEGCILLGSLVDVKNSSVLQSRKAFAKVMPLIVKAVGEGKVTLEII